MVDFSIIILGAEDQLNMTDSWLHSEYTSKTNETKLIYQVPLVEPT
jgi:hypothetical protein